MNCKERKYKKTIIKFHYERKIHSLESKIEWLEHELNYRLYRIDHEEEIANKNWEIVVSQRTQIAALLLALDDAIGISQHEELLEEYKQKVKYVSDFVSWIDSEPPMWRLLEWRRWKNSKPERIVKND